jgi:hypothetical protein
MANAANDFSTRWLGSGAAERSNYQLFPSGLCRLLVLFRRRNEIIRSAMAGLPRYTKTRSIEPFPFPAATEAQKARVWALGEHVDARGPV